MIGSSCLPFGPSGSGAFTMSSTSSFCQAVSAQATTNASALMISLLAQLVEMVDDREPVLVRDRPNPPHALRGSCG